MSLQNRKSFLGSNHAAYRISSALVVTALFALAACSSGETDTTEAAAPDLELPALDTAGLAPDEAAAKRIMYASALHDSLRVLAEAAFEFHFRDRMYRYQRTGGAFTYERR